MSDLLIELDNIVKSYSGTQNVLDGLDLGLKAGEVVAIIGRSGSGKSTLLNILGQMDQSDSGRYLFRGEDTSAWNDDQRTAFRRSQLGFVFQSYNLLPSLSVAENIMLPLEINARPPGRRCEQLLHALGLSELRSRFPDSLSGGEQQRVAIARALVHQPPLVIADEPTGHLDFNTGQQVVALFEQHIRLSGTALIMATHSAEMTGHADRVLEIRNGKLRPV